MTEKRQRHTPKGFEQAETFGYFRVAKSDVAVAITQRLTASQLRLWLYLMMIDSFADQTGSGGRIYHNIPTPTEIAEKIGASADTVQKDLRMLRKLKLYDYQITGMQGYNCSAEHAEAESQRLKQKRTSVKSFSRKDSACLSPESACLSPESACLSPESACLNPKQEPESLSGKDSGSLHTLQTYTDFTNSLSDSERESFEKFVREEWRKLKGEEIVSLERFLSRKEDFDNWHEKFLNSSAGRAAKEEAIATQFDWCNDPRFSDWIWKAFNEGYLWTQSDEAEREQRHAFLRWAQTTNAYKGVCY